MVMVEDSVRNKTISLKSRKKAWLYECLCESLTELSSDDVEIAIQNMPPFPRHFGGQRYQHLFVDASEIEGFCKETPFRIC